MTLITEKNFPLRRGCPQGGGGIGEVGSANVEVQERIREWKILSAAAHERESRTLVIARRNDEAISHFARKISKLKPED
jgi:hypothetical protein